MREAQKIWKGGKGEGEKKREKMCVEVFSCNNGSNLFAPTLQLTALPTTTLHERRRERSHQCPMPGGGMPQVGASSQKKGERSEAPNPQDTYPFERGKE